MANRARTRSNQARETHAEVVGSLLGKRCLQRSSGSLARVTPCFVAVLRALVLFLFRDILVRDEICVATLR